MAQRQPPPRPVSRSSQSVQPCSSIDDDLSISRHNPSATFGTTCSDASNGYNGLSGPDGPSGAEEEKQEIERLRPRWLIKEERGWRRAVQNFTPSWFSTTMGTGIIPILLNALSKLYLNLTFLNTLVIILFIFNTILFSLILLTSILRYSLYSKTWTLMIRHPVQSLFLGTAPMGFATLVTLWVNVCVPKWSPDGGWAQDVAWAGWWIDVAASVATACGLPFLMMYAHPSNPLPSMTAAWLLPVVAPIVASATGATVASSLSNPHHALITTIGSYILWGISAPLTLMILVIYFHRLALHKLPPKEVIVSVFLPVGPMGQGGFAILELGKVAMKIFPETHTLSAASTAGDTLYVLGFLTALILWGFGLVWLFFALASITRSKFPFNMGWWGFTFPLGVYAMSTISLGRELPSAIFRIFGTTLSLCVVLLWFVVAAYTVKKAMTGEMFHAPCLQTLEREKARPCERRERTGLDV